MVSIKCGATTEPVNDRGEFRTAQLPRGRYFLVTTLHPSPSTAKRAREQEQTTWYPNALGQDEATPIPVQAGQELQGIEIRLRKSATYWIRGKVIGLAGAASETTAEGAWRKPGVSAIVPSSNQQYGGRCRRMDRSRSAACLREATRYVSAKLGSAVVACGRTDWGGPRLR